jgi:hypothetical protein
MLHSHMTYMQSSLFLTFSLSGVASIAFISLCICRAEETSTWLATYILYGAGAGGGLSVPTHV